MDKSCGQAPRYRWYQVRLRTGLLGLTLIAVALGFWSTYVRPYLAQAELRDDTRNWAAVLNPAEIHAGCNH